MDSDPAPLLLPPPDKHTHSKSQNRVLDRDHFRTVLKNKSGLFKSVQSFFFLVF